MKTENALDCMEFLSPELLDEAESYRPARKSNSWMKWGAVAACLCICVIGALKFYLPLHDSGNGTEPGYGMTDYNAPVPGGVNIEETGNESETNVKMMISHFDNSLNNEDMAVYNGHCELSNSLKAAINEYGDTVKYRVVVEVFKDGTVINSGSAEVASEEARLVNEKYTVAHETYEDTAETMDYFTIHAEKDQLLDFPVNSSYGYFISLYDEYLGLAEPKVDLEVVNGIATDVPVDESNESFMHATEYPAEILEMQQAVSDAMTRGDLPYVVTSSICENPLRLEIGVTTTDEKKIQELKSAFDPSGHYMVIVQSSGAIKEDVEVKN